MELYNQTTDLKIIGLHVAAFPIGIKDAFGSLMKTLGGRDFYGISWMDDNDKVQYYAMATEAFEGEAKQYHYELLTIEKGKYKTETLHNWMSQTDCIKDVFHDLTAGTRPDKNHPCIEWYKSDEEMVCMVKAV